MMSFPPDYFSGKKVTVMGLGHFGGQITVVKYLASQGAILAVTDTAPAEKLQKSIEQIKHLSITLHLGGHVEADFTDANMIVVSPAVPKNSRYLKLAAQNNIPLTSEMNLFLDRCRGKVAAITGTVGKSTTLAMTETILTRLDDSALKSLGYRRVWCGGNIGKSLLEDLSRIQQDDLVVLELSSFQLEDLAGIEYSPEIALITNIRPNHLDRHGTMENYIDAKSNITRFQQQGDFLITRQDDESSIRIRELVPEGVTQWQFGSDENEEIKILVNRDPLHSEGKHLTVRQENGQWSVLIHQNELAIPGDHNLFNAAGAACLCLALGLQTEWIADGLRHFNGLTDRLELVANHDQIRWFNDSKSTTAVSGIVALKSFEPGTIHAIVGGYDKGIDLMDFSREMAKRCSCVYCVGQTAKTIADVVRLSGGQAMEFATFDEAVLFASESAIPGQVVLLSPGCASWDMFENYQQRGEIFKNIVQRFVQSKSPAHSFV